MMNENIFKGKWREFKGHVQNSWGKLTDDELEETRGDMNKISGLVQSRYGLAQEKIKEKINSFLSSMGLEGEDDSDYGKSANL